MVSKLLFLSQAHSYYLVCIAYKTVCKSYLSCISWSKKLVVRSKKQGVNTFVLE